MTMSQTSTLRYSWNPSGPETLRLCESLLSYHALLITLLVSMPILTGQINQSSLQPSQGGGGGRGVSLKPLNRDEQTGLDWGWGRSLTEMESHFYPGVVGVGWWNSHKSFLIELRQEITSKLSPTHSHRAKHSHLSPRNTKYLPANCGHTYSLNSSDHPMETMEQTVTKHRSDINKNSPPAKRPEFLFGATRRERRWFASQQHRGLFAELENYRLNYFD